MDVVEDNSRESKESVRVVVEPSGGRWIYDSVFTFIDAMLWELGEKGRRA